MTVEILYTGVLVACLVSLRKRDEEAVAERARPRR